MAKTTKEEGTGKQIIEMSSTVREQEIIPKKDFNIIWNHVRIELKKGEKASVPVMFIENLKTEQVI